MQIDRSRADPLESQEMLTELTYDVEELHTYCEVNEGLLNDEQRDVYETILQKATSGSGGLFFLDAPGGTGKTFVLKLILARLR